MIYILVFVCGSERCRPQEAWAHQARSFICQIIQQLRLCLQFNELSDLFCGKVIIMMISITPVNCSHHDLAQTSSRGGRPGGREFDTALWRVSIWKINLSYPTGFAKRSHLLFICLTSLYSLVIDHDHLLNGGWLKNIFALNNHQLLPCKLLKIPLDIPYNTLLRWRWRNKNMKNLQPSFVKVVIRSWGDPEKVGLVLFSMLSSNCNCHCFHVKM